MFKKILTHLIILALTVLPVQVITAGVESSSMQMSMMKSAQLKQKCMHTSATDSQETTTIAAASCCDDSSHQCDRCGTCPQAASSMTILPAYFVEKTTSLDTQKFLISHLLLNGVPQKNLLRPPRSFI